MLKNYIKIAIRNLRKNPGYSFINISGLTIGIVCCLFIFQYVAFEYSFDDFNEKAQNLYRITWTRVQSGGDPNISATVGHAMGPALTQEVPEVARFVRLHPEYFSAVVSNPVNPDQAFEEDQVYYADPAFFQMFSYPLKRGESGQVLSEPGTVLLSESTARKYFGNEDPIGKVLDIRAWISGTFRVAGVFEDIPANSHLQFDILLPMADLLQKNQYRDPSNDWGLWNFITYVQFHPNTDVAEVEQKFTDVFMSHQGEEFQQTGITAYVDLQPLTDIHLNEDITAPKAVMGSYRSVYFFTIIGLITLLIALINYVNLATARAIGRAREVGVRKAIGAQKRQLITQFLYESSPTIFTATVLAVALADLLMPVVNNLVGIHLTNSIWTSMDFWAVFVVTFCIASLLAGLYPAFVLSSFRPVTVLKGKSGGRAASGAGLRRGLVVFQFAVSIVLLTGTVTVYTQLNYMQNMDLGINLEQVLVVPSPRVLPEGTEKEIAVETFIQELRRLPAVRQTATSFTVPGQGFAWGSNSIRKTAEDPSTEVTGVGTWIDSGFANLYGIELVAGEGFSNISNPTPEGELNPIIANETAIQALGFASPKEALGQKLSHGRIVGVFKDFNWSSAHEARENIFFNLARNNPQVSVKVNTKNLPKTIAAIEEIYKQHFPGDPFRYAFVDEQFDQQYKNDQRFARLFTVFAGLAIAIACLVLFGLATFTAEQRTKEIGVRKVMGATVANIVGLLSKDFLKLVLLGFVIAVPIAWYTMNRWLADFAYRIDIGPGIFAIAGGAALLIAIATVSWQSIKAALMNPVNSLRSE